MVAVVGFSRANTRLTLDDIRKCGGVMSNYSRHDENIFRPKRCKFHLLHDRNLVTKSKRSRNTVIENNTFRCWRSTSQSPWNTGQWRKKMVRYVVVAACTTVLFFQV